MRLRTEGRLVGTVLGVGAFSLATGQVAHASAFENEAWGQRTTGLYFMSAGIHPAWISFINHDVDQYDALDGTPSTNQPSDWTYCAGNCSQTVFDEESRSSTVCGRFESYYRVTLQEFGHSQGLGHSCAGGAVMWACDTSTNDLALSGDDKVGMREIYDTGFTGPGPTSPCNGSGGR